MESPITYLKHLREKKKQIIEKNAFNKDVAEVIESIKKKMGKEYRFDNNVTVGKAVEEIYEDLDWKLALANNQEHARKRLEVVGEAMERLKVYDEKNIGMKVSQFLSPKYLVRC